MDDYGRRFVFETMGYRCPNRRVGFEIRLGETKTVLANGRVVVFQGAANQFGRERFQALERSQGVPPRYWIRIALEKRFELGDDGVVAPQYEQFLGGVAPPAIGVR